ncbi:helix-turn-helix domain-containing protein [Scytonema sp. UIC 10036]|uniref:GlxA family transcriptional regulator n=1 Tax=Scytonema sp. UIC 10036 TaxID=2304196 RepID=UPI0012DA6DE8|nr:GlxA family transcriptional regulator [Scytonema sp. UIC 10036]MUG95341.1 helix-turn-helix domain-containing protein [Scytonema sp. UIC 10036]
MTSQHSTSGTVKQRVIFLILEGVELLDLAGPAQVFSIAVSLGAPYSLHFCANTSGVRSAQGLFLGQLDPLPSVSVHDVVMVAGVALERLNQPLLDADTRCWLMNAHTNGTRIASICTGAAVLGEAGLLDSRRCTTHWFVMQDLQQRYPMAHVVDGVLYVSDGGIVTSAGIASGIDMALSLIEQQHGPRLAAEVARYLVIYLRRNGTQPQRSVYLEYRNHLHPGVHRVQNWLAEHAMKSVSLTELAQIANMSVRSFSRAFKEVTGLTPVQYQQRLRLEVASTLLQNSDLSIEAIATRCGFDDSRHFRRLWQRYFGVSPSTTRKKQTKISVA